MEKAINIQEHISSIISLEDNQWELILNALESKVIDKDDHLLREGEVSDSIAFISSGTLIYYKDLENGDQMTTDFGFEGDWVTDNYSRLNNCPSLINIKAIEKSKLYILKNNELIALYNKIPSLERLGRVVTERFFLKMVEHNIDLQTLSAKERYLKLLKNHPEIFQRIPQYHIANYLGIAPKSLSRIRSEIFNKD
ncbi:Crp/Fnr family transcriptional regulator [Dysgonomonas sp. HGC4]|uniref:Crp/Fnr family transcriptional regulator n=1 Tax=Dysgonomonas sp. HGC4 TaxID=1658009 RepID=UPI0006822AB1|nr:Crp/Fnr family transcriptional regulator [Dysgonomonas sp. HGC4]